MSVDPGPRPELTWLPVDRCYVDEAYQRSLETPRGEKLISKIADEFSWPKFGVVLASPGEPDDLGPRWLIIDGQHRHAGARRHGAIAQIPAVVHRLDRAAQATAFVGANRDRIPVSAQAVFHAGVAAGNADACEIAKACADAGIAIERHNKAANQLGADRTAAVPALQQIMKKFGSPTMRSAVECLAGAFRGQAGALRGPLFHAAAILLADDPGRVDIQRAFAALGWRKLDEIGRGAGGGQFTRINAIVARLQKQCSSRIQPGAVRAPSSTATASPATHLPARRPVPAPAPKLKTAETDDAAIARFLATKSVTLVQSPEQVAEYLRGKGLAAVIRPGFAMGGGEPGKPSPAVGEITLSGRAISLDKLYAVANEMRAGDGLKPLTAPKVVA